MDIAVESKIRTFLNLFAPLQHVASFKAYHFAIAVYLALQQMIQHYLPAVIFSLEMTKHQMEYRLWSLMSRMDCYQHLGLTPIHGDRLMV
ncbi:MAG: hypothetical protein ACRC1Z_04755 [Waterburya sp.]